MVGRGCGRGERGGGVRERGRGNNKGKVRMRKHTVYRRKQAENLAMFYSKQPRVSSKYSGKKVNFNI